MDKLERTHGSDDPVLQATEVVSAMLRSRGHGERLARAWSDFIEEHPRSAHAIVEMAMQISEEQATTDEAAKQIFIAGYVTGQLIVKTQQDLANLEQLIITPDFFEGQSIPEPPAA
jgi:hypothetical protein